MRKRYYLSFDMDNPRHREAEAMISNQGSRQRTEYVVTSILSAKQADYIEKLVRQSFRDELLRITWKLPKATQDGAAGNVQLTDLPVSLIRAMDEI